MPQRGNSISEGQRPTKHEINKYKSALKGRKQKPMPQSLSKVYVHIIFSTKHRQNLIDDNIEASLHDYLGGVCKGLGCNPVRIGGYKDHVHV
jgi:hypothetical protein